MELVKQIENKLHSTANYIDIFSGLANYDTYLAGGFIRNTLLDRPIKDLDLFINSSLKSLSGYLAHLETKGKLNYGPFGAPRWFSPNDTFYVDIVPFSKFVVNQKSYNTIEQILNDFDITINAIAFDINKKEIINPLKGIEDISNRVIRATHFNFPDITIISSNIKISSLTVFWFRLMHYKFLLDFEFENNTLDWIRSNKHRYSDLENFKTLFFEPVIDYEFLESI